MKFLSKLDETATRTARGWAEVKLLGLDSTRWLLWALEALAPRVLVPQQGDHIYDLIVPSIYRPFCPKANTRARVGLSVYSAWLDPKGETRLVYHWTRVVQDRGSFSQADP